MDSDSFKRFVGYIKHKLYSDQKWLERGVVAIYEKQTDHERRSGTSLEHNKIGFSGYDAGLMSTYARWLITGGHLAGEHYYKVRNKMMKYASQLARIAVEKRKAKQGLSQREPRQEHLFGGEDLQNK